MTAIEKKEYHKQYREKNKEKKRESSKKWKLKNKEKISQSNKLYNLNNKEKISQYAKKWYLKNKEKIKEYKLNNIEKIKKGKTKYYFKNKDTLFKKANIYTKNKRLNNPLYKLTCSIRSRIYLSIKKSNYTKRSKTYQILGCSFEEFKNHLEKQFTEGMSWQNHGEWHLDHIYPVSKAKDEEHLIKLNHYTNFQPLWAEDNLKKGNKILC